MSATIMKQYNPGLTDPQLRQLIAAHIDDDSFCRYVIQQDINKIALDLREAHKDDFFSVPEDNPLEDFLQTAEAVSYTHLDVYKRQGLGTVWVCYFQPDVIRKEFDLPDNLEPINILVIGYGNEAPSDRVPGNLQSTFRRKTYFHFRIDIHHRILFIGVCLL